MTVLRAIAVLLVLCATAYGQDSAGEQYRLTFDFAHPVAGHLFGNGSTAVEHDTDPSERSFRVAWPSAIYKQKPWLQEWGGVIDIWSHKDDGSRTWEVRPFVGVQLSTPTSHRVRLLNLTRVEWLNMVRGNDDDDQTRLRNRVEVQFPLTSHGWKPGGYYGVGEFEPFVNLDDGFVETVRVGGSVGSVLSDRVRIEAEFLGEWSRKTSGDPLPYTDTLVRINVKFGFKRGLLDEIGLTDPGS